MSPRCTTPPQDKREATKWRNRRAIVDAASELAARHGVGGFTVNDLAERAGVSRRTVFNHFTSVDEAVFESFSDRIGALYDQIEASLGQGGFASMPEAYTAFAGALRSVDIIGTAHALLSSLQGRGWPRASEASEPPEVAEIWMNRIMEGIVLSCADSLQARMGTDDPFEVRLLVEVVANALAVCVRQWVETADGPLTPASRREWDQLLDRALNRLGTGFGHDGTA